MWPSMNRRFPQTDSVEAIEGTAAHWVAWEILSNRPITAGAKAPNDTIVTEEMIESGELVADTIRLRLQIFGMQLHIEYLVTMIKHSTKLLITNSAIASLMNSGMNKGSVISLEFWIFSRANGEWVSQSLSPLLT